MTSIFDDPPKTKAFSNQNKGHLGSRYIYIYIPAQKSPRHTLEIPWLEILVNAAPTSFFAPKQHSEPQVDLWMMIPTTPLSNNLSC